MKAGMRYLCMVLMALSLMLTGCGGEQENEGEQDSEQIVPGGEGGEGGEDGENGEDGEDEESDD